MADYISQFTGSEIDQRLAKVPQVEAALAGKQATLVSGTNIKTINGQSVLGSGDMTIQAGDTDAVKYVAQTLTDAQKAQARANIDAASLADIADFDFVTVTSLPTASASTMGHIYLVGPDANDNYDRYYTQQSGSTYSWVALGSTEIDLSGYATQAELNQLEAEVHQLAGKFYGVFADDSDLPEGDATGYAFVGEENPYAIWNFDGEEWADSGATVNGITGEPGVGFESVASPDPADGTAIITLSNGDTVTIDLNHNHPAYYSKVLGGAQPVGGFEPDVVYSLGTLSGTITFSLASPVTGNVNHYFWMFDTGVSAPTITWPAGLTWAAGSAPTVVANKHYEISILGGIGYYSEV